MIKQKNKYLIIAAGTLLGAIVGFIYWKLVGCENGCAIKSVWWRMTLWAAAMGGLLTNILLDFYEKYKIKNELKNPE